MEYILINESKLKVICEESDLDPYGICADSLEYGDACSRKFLEDLRDEAKVRFGFETAQHRVLIQLCCVAHHRHLARRRLELYRVGSYELGGHYGFSGTGTAVRQIPRQVPPERQAAL